MKAILYTLLVLIILGGICVVTCPDHEAHSTALKNLCNRMLTEKLSQGATEEEAGWVAFGSMLGTGIGGFVIDNMLNVENYFVCSIGTMTYDGETKIVSVGMLNHVFTADDEKVLQMADEVFD